MVEMSDNDARTLCKCSETLAKHRPNDLHIINAIRRIKLITNKLTNKLKAKDNETKNKQA